MSAAFYIREAHPDELVSLGQLMVGVYSTLEGFPTPEEQPGYYGMLANLGALAARPGARILVALADNRVLGGVVYFSEMGQYGSGGTATQATGASGFRLLAVDPRMRGMGIGKGLVQACLDLAKEHQHGQVIIHTTNAMKVAWGMYEVMGFRRSRDLDFLQGELEVFGFRLKL